MVSYCEAAAGDPWHGPYHDQEYGFPLTDDNLLFERLVLEINQAGLSWLTILKRRDAFRKAFSGFDINLVARFTEKDELRLMSDPGIIRNRLKIKATIENARRLIQIRETDGSIRAWLDRHHPQELTDWTRLFKKNFQFTGSEIVREFLVSTGYLPGAHIPDCPVYERIQTLSPPWMEAIKRKSPLF